MTRKADPALFHQGQERIKRGGLAKEVFTGYNGSACILGSLGWEQQSHPAELELLGELLGFYAPPYELCGCGCGGADSLFNAVTDWNDVPERTAEDVIALLEQAEQKAEANR